MENKVAYITGGSKGIGYAIAEALVKNGMRVAITSRRQDSAERAARNLQEKTKRQDILPLQSDVRNLADETAAVGKVIDKWGQLDVLIANAGVGHFGSIEDLEPEQWNKVIESNLTGVYHSVKATVPHLKRSQGYIMTIASLAGTNFFAGGSAYNASKFGLVGFTQAIMLDLRHQGIKTTVIMPGSVATQFNDRVVSDADSWKIQPEDLGEIVVDLLKIHPRTLPSKVEVRPTRPPTARP